LQNFDPSTALARIGKNGINLRNLRIRILTLPEILETNMTTNDTTERCGEEDCLSGTRSLGKEELLVVLPMVFFGLKMYILLASSLTD